MSFEFASRGCKKIDLVEINYPSVCFVKEVIQKLDLKEIQAYKADVFAFVKKCASAYTLIFADPPYNMKNIETLPDLIFTHQLLDDGGWFILEHSKSYSFSSHDRFREERKYGSVHFSVFE